MENIYKIKVKTNPDPRWLYPSERRYSASIVLGLGVVHLALAGTALLLACLTLTANETPNNGLPSHNNEDNNDTNATNNKLHDMTDIQIDSHQGYKNPEVFSEDGSVDKFNSNATNYDLGVAIKDKQKEENFSNDNRDENEANSSYPSANLTLAPCLMCLGSLAAGLTGLLAWKRWYIDHNIKWFFCMSFISNLTSLISLIMVGTLVIFSNEVAGDYFSTTSKPSPKFVITVNILIASILEWLWSVLSTRISFAGMKNDYPDDIVISRSGGKIEVNTVHKGNMKGGKAQPPDILNHFPVSGKIAKYFPKKQSSNLPKEESNSEYQERVNKFLSSNVDTNSTT